MTDASLLVDSFSQRLGGTHPASESAKAHAGLPERSPRGASGSNSILATCVCSREFLVRSKSEDLPYHPEPDAIGYLKQVCHGSGRRASVFTEA